MADLLDLAERLWRGQASTEEHHPLFGEVDAAEVGAGVLFVRAFGNVTAVRADDGLVLVDAGSAMTAAQVHQRVRAWSEEPVRTVVLTHGHVDHVLGLGPFEAEGTRPRVVAHEDVARRFDRYRRTAGYNAAVNARQFGVPGLSWPTEYPALDETYRHRLEVSGLELRHARGETDDATWVWAPDRGVLCTGDLFIWAFPNAGNPQKVQRYPAEWAAALREMAGLGAEVLLPGHGWPILGAGRVRRALEETAEALEIVSGQTVRLMNEGRPLGEILERVRVPERLLERPYLWPVYDDPEFAVRTVWRLEGGWWDGDPASLKPAPDAAVAAEVASLAGGAGALARRAREVAEAGDLRLAGHLAEWAWLAAPDDDEVRAVRASVLDRRAATEPSLMARNLFRAISPQPG
ncbi:MAG: alkyl sulfatase dimerization domain-containing protein [Actinomycetota bacterium]